MAYNLNQVAMISGLTTRTLRNHINLGLLKGEKIDGNWRFTEEELEAYLADPMVRQATKARSHAVIYDFLADSFKQSNRICTILDFPVSADEAIGISQFFGREICDHGADIEFRYINEKHFARFILSGSEEQVKDLMQAYYSR